MNAKARKRKRQRERKEGTISNPTTPAQQEQKDYADEQNSLAKKSRDRGEQQHPPSEPPNHRAPNINNTATNPRGKKTFLTERDGDAYHRLLEGDYPGFCHLPASRVGPPPFHAAAQRALEALRDAGHYQYDVVQAGGTVLSRTFVRRTLVGDPGITYKYLGLRLFAHAWSSPSPSSSSGGGGGPQRAVPDRFRRIGELNRAMVRMTREQLRAARAAGRELGTVGSCRYNLTLINHMEPSSETALKDEETYRMGKASVSWHADSSLQDHSAIGVYHTLPTQKRSVWDWRIALRRNPEDDGDTEKDGDGGAAATRRNCPAVAVRTRAGDAYFLLGDFNHTHQHMVLAGSAAHRISSTHRVAVVGRDTYDYIRGRCSAALTSFRAELKRSGGGGGGWNPNVILEAQAVLTEVEFEWIAQYWVQGAKHDEQHVWWQAPMRALEEAWGALEKLTHRVVHAILKEHESDAKHHRHHHHHRELLPGLIASLQARQELRTKWDERRANKIYKRRITRPYQPVEHPVFVDNNNDNKKRLPKDLTETIRSLSLVLSQQMEGIKPGQEAHGNGSGKRRKHSAAQIWHQTEKQNHRKKQKGKTWKKARS